jgi:exosortase A-associated hydrolase 1
MAEAAAEEVLGFSCAGEALWGIVARPAPGAPVHDTAVLIVVGGPQYRVGSHRQFVLLARRVARAGYPSLRFDVRGMGDSEGELRTFESIAPDIEAAMAALQRACPACTRVVVWGLCDAASAALMFAAVDPKVAGIVALNPWARSVATLAATRVKHYYRERLLQREFWAKLFGGAFDWRAALRALAANLRQARGRPGAASGTAPAALPFQDRMAQGLKDFRGRVLLILSGNDLTAQEFLEYTTGSPAWRGLLAQPKVRRVDLPDADHTFSRRPWQDRVETETIDWLRSLPASSPTNEGHP